MRRLHLNKIFKISKPTVIILIKNLPSLPFEEETLMALDKCGNAKVDTYYINILHNELYSGGAF